MRSKFDGRKCSLPKSFELQEVFQLIGPKLTCI
jgi:hypothetical protein